MSSAISPPLPRRIHRRVRAAFTMVELLVVILIVLLVSAVVLPQVLPALAHRQVTEAGRILQAGLVQARAEAVKANAPRGMRLLTDPTYANSASIVAYNRWVPIEPGPDYSAGQVVIWPIPKNDPNNTNGDQTLPASAFPFSNTPNGGIPYPSPLGGIYPYLPQAITGSTFAGQVLMVEMAPLMKNTLDAPSGGGFNNPTSWAWNIRLGDKIQVGGEGRTYTVVGPCVLNPLNGNNPELFVNDGPPGNPMLLQRNYNWFDSINNTIQTFNATGIDYLFVVNSEDDDADGWVDSGWNGVDDTTAANGSSAAAISFNYNGIVDDLSEWEIEQWTGAQQAMQNYPQQFVNRVTGPFTPYQAAVALTWQALAKPVDYVINRRPVVSPGARETALPENVVIDATSWNSTAERSRLPIDPKSKYVDILLNPTGQAVLTTQYSTPASYGETASFFHFWISEREDVHEISDVWGLNTANTPPTPNPNPNAAAPNNLFMLPIPAQFTTGLANPPTLTLKGERLLLTLFTRTGQVTVNAVEFFDAADVNHPFYDSQLGAREAK